MCGSTWSCLLTSARKNKSCLSGWRICAAIVKIGSEHPIPVNTGIGASNSQLYRILDDTLLPMVCPILPIDYPPCINQPCLQLNSARCASCCGSPRADARDRGDHLAG